MQLSKLSKYAITAVSLKCRTLENASTYERAVAAYRKSNSEVEVKKMDLTIRRQKRKHLLRNYDLGTPIF